MGAPRGAGQGAAGVAQVCASERTQGVGVALFAGVDDVVAAVGAAVSGADLAGLPIGRLTSGVTADEFPMAVGAASVAVCEVAVVALLAGFPEPVAAVGLAIFVDAVGAAPVAVCEVAVVALLGGCQHAVAAVRAAVIVAHGAGLAEA